MISFLITKEPPRIILYHLSSRVMIMSRPSGRDSRLNEQIKRGDHAAFESLFKAYYDELSTFAWRYVQSPQVAEDIVQEVFVRIWRRREHWNLTGPVKTYLYSAVRNEALKHLEHENVVRRGEDRVKVDFSYEARTPDEELTYKQLACAVEKIISDLPDRRREIFILHRQHSFTYREIAELLDISVATVETQIARALDSLRKLTSSFTVF